MSALSGVALVQQTVMAIDSGIVQGVIQKAEVHQVLPVYFHLDIEEILGNTTRNDLFPPTVNQLELGKTYRVKVTSNTNPVVGRSPIYVQTSLELLLMTDTPVLNIGNPRIELPMDQATRFKHEFNLIVPEEVPHLQIQLRLYYRDLTDEYFEREPIACRDMQLVGTYNLIEQSLLQACHVDLVAERPSRTAIVHVEDSGETGKIKLTCFGHYADHNISTLPFTPPNIRLADFVEVQKDAKTILEKIRAFSDDTANIKIKFDSPKGSSDKTNLTLLGWINILYQRIGETLQIVIYDHTDSEIPWEMLEIEPGKYLGAIVPIARWLPIPLSAIEFRKLIINPEQHKGRVIAYLDEDMLPDAITERQILESFDTQFQQSIHDLHVSLNQSLSEVGLVYLACPGMFAPYDSDAVAYSFWNYPGERLIPLHLELLETQGVARPIVFVNACHSGRVIRHKDRWRLHGLPLVMLKRIASGYIGSLGQVNSRNANQIGHSILEAILNNREGVQPLQLLYQLRATAAQQLNANKELYINQLDFIYTFMYVYYGNPLAQLQLLPAQASGANSE